MNVFSKLGEKWPLSGKAAAAIALSLALMAAGCGGGGKTASKGSSTGGKAQTLTVGMTNAPKSFNPLSQPDAAGRYLQRFMFDCLLGEPEPNKFTNHLAVSFDTKDKQTYTVKLNDKAKWSDGKPVTADDVIFTMNTIANPKVETTWGRYVKIIEGTDDKGRLASGTTISGLKKIDNLTFEFKCKRPMDPNYVKDQIGFNILVMPKHIYEKIEPAKIASSQEVLKPTVFSGAFKFTKYVTNDHVEMAANDKYLQGAPKLKKIFFKIQNGTNLVVDLKAGKVQMSAGAGIARIPINDIDVLKKEKNLVVKNVPSLGSQFIMINNQNPVFNKNLRMALGHAVNRKQIVDQLYKGYAYVNPTVYTTASPVFDKTVKNFPYDPELAKKELAASGYDTSKEMTLMVPLGNVQREQSADLIQQNLQAIGLKVKLQKMDFPTLMTHNNKGDFEIMLLGLTLAADPDYLNLFQPGSLSNFQKVDDAKLTEMMEAAAFEADSAKRADRYKAIQKYMAENMFNVPLYGEEDFIIQSKNLVGGMKPYWYGSLDDVHKWELK